MALTDTKVKSANVPEGKKQAKIANAGGVIFLVTGSGAMHTSNDALCLCAACDFQQFLTEILPYTPFASVDAMCAEAHRFHCSVCGAKDIGIKAVDAVA